MNEYEHTQPGTLIRVTLGSAILLASAAAFYPLFQNRAPEFQALIPVAILMICLALFHSLTVTVTSNDIALAFGAGLIRKEFMIGEVRTASIVRTRWYYGWGIRKIWKGWLYNVSGFDAVRLEMQNGRIVQIGTDEPAKLLAAITAAISHRGISGAR